MNPPFEPHALAGVQEFLGRLRSMDWEAGEAMRLSRQATWEDVATAPLAANVRLLLSELDSEGGAKATATGNLGRAFVARCAPQLRMPELLRRSVLDHCKVVNEMDLWTLHLARVVAECAGFVRRRSGRFHSTLLGRRLLEGDQAGEFYRRVFLAYFRKFDLTYDFTLRPVPEIQETLAAILWRLDRVAADWTPVADLAPRILLPRVYQCLVAAMTYAADTEAWILRGHVIGPLMSMGLLERRGAGAEDVWLGETGEIRVTRLWRRFIWFEWQL